MLALSLERTTPLSVLLVEDDLECVLLARHILGRGTDFGRVLHAATLERSIELLGKESIDIVLLDLNLSDSAGLETLGVLHSKFPSVPVVVLTAQNLSGADVEALRMGAQDYLEKERVHYELLWRVLRYAVERSNRRFRLDIAFREREALAVARPTAATNGSSHNGASLRTSYPAEFDLLKRDYRRLLELALEERLSRTAAALPDRVRDMAQDLGFLRAGPRDVVELHLAALKIAIETSPSTRSQVLAEEGRIVVLSLMGQLTEFYRCTLGAYPGTTMPAP
jgi:DNA-binding response OmpR family regulator